MLSSGADFGSFGSGVSTVAGPQVVLEQAEQADRLSIVVGAATDTGGRSENEDAIFVGDLPPVPSAAETGLDQGVVESGFLLAVADGMGGYQRGEVASRLAIESLQRALADDPGADTALLLKQAFREANREIFANGHAGGSDQILGTTLVAAVIRGKYLTIANIGDSRAYLLRANQLTQITRDHSLVAEQVSQGTLTPREARESRHRNVLTQGLGLRETLDKKMPSIFELTLLPEDRLLLCSDGFYDVVRDEDFVETLIERDPPDAARQLVDLAVERGTTDNVSAVVAGVLPARVALREPVLADGPAGDRPGYLVPLVVLSIVLFVALVLLALTVL